MKFFVLCGIKTAYPRTYSNTKTFVGKEKENRLLHKNAPLFLNNPTIFPGFSGNFFTKSRVCPLQRRRFCGIIT
jgi:hypothetical protein